MFHRNRITSIRVTTPGNMAGRILVVDNEPLVCDSVRRVLALDQHMVEEVTSAQDALVAFEPGKFDLIIIDYEMPDTKGDKLAAAIKALAPEQPILMITAYAETLRLAGLFPLSVDLVMSKPFEIREFRETVRQMAAKE
jgi:CheY-like chemotaxis protein